MITHIAPESNEEPVYHVSPDGKLALTVIGDVDGEQLIGFHGFDWSVQMSILGEVTGTSPREAGMQFIQDVLQDKAMIAVLLSQGMITDVWITEDPKVDRNYLKPGEELQFRYWSGKSAE